MKAIDIALLLKPFAVFVIAIPGALIVWWIKRKMPDCKLKRFLLYKYN